MITKLTLFTPKEDDRKRELSSVIPFKYERRRRRRKVKEEGGFSERHYVFDIKGEKKFISLRASRIRCPFLLVKAGWKQSRTLEKEEGNVMGSGQTVGACSRAQKLSVWSEFCVWGVIIMTKCWYPSEGCVRSMHICVDAG
jgi:hypothetical protein